MTVSVSTGPVRAPRVSVGIPVYNREHLIAETIESVLAQTFEDFELVICDNGSTDGTAEVCREYAALDPRVKFHRNDENRGAAYNFNRVFELSSGEYFKWLAADDLCEPQFLEHCVQALDANPAASLAYPRANFIDADGAVVEVFDEAGRLADWPRSPRARVRQMLDALFGREVMGICMVGTYGLARSSALARTGLIGNYTGADWTVVVELALEGEILEIPGRYSLFRRHPDSSSWHNFQRVSRETYAKGQAAFYDPKLQGRASVTFQLWRRYLEMPLAIVRSPLSLLNRGRLLLHYARLMVRRITPKLGRTLRSTLGRAR